MDKICLIKKVIPRQSIYSNLKAKLSYVSCINSRVLVIYPCLLEFMFTYGELYDKCRLVIYGPLA
jgi:hypothetical protein